MNALEIIQMAEMVLSQDPTLTVEEVTEIVFGFCEGSNVKKSAVALLVWEVSIR